jgi:phosphate:Na+ symporter
VWFIKPIARLVERLVPERIRPDKAIDDPKFLTEKALKYPETLVASLEDETKYLFKNAVFEIVSHALNIHRGDIKSSTKLKKVIRKSQTDMGADVHSLYQTKVKNIYGEILRYATLGQSKLDLSPQQNTRVAQLKIANRKMVEVVKTMNELKANTAKYMSSENEYVKAEYEKFRKKIAKVLRIIYRFRTKTDKEKYHKRLVELSRVAQCNLYTTGTTIDRLIRKELVTVDMGSSLVNDHDNVNDTIEKLIEIADLLYGEKDPLFKEGLARITEPVDQKG